MTSNIIRAGILCLLLPLVILGCSLGTFTNPQGRVTKLDGRINEGVYISPKGLFSVDVPEMDNPFIKKPSVIRDEMRPDGGAEVNFSVPDLGEAWRFGARPLMAGSPNETMLLAELSDQELTRWLNTPARPNVILEEKVQLADGSGIARIYHQETASLLFARRGDTADVRESALIGVVVAISKEKNHVLYAVGQFDMPMEQLSFLIEDVKMPKEEALRLKSSEQMQSLQQHTTSLRLQ